MCASRSRHDAAGERRSSKRPGPASRCAAGTPYRARSESVEHDASAAAHLYALGGRHGRVDHRRATPLLPANPTGTSLEVLAPMGASFIRGPIRHHRSSGKVISPVLTVNLGAMPDQLPTIAALGALAQGDTVIRGVAIARGHESDRIHAVAIELRCLGASVDETRGRPCCPWGRCLARRSNRHPPGPSHRHGLCSALAAVVPGVEIADPGCVAKTYPGFFDDIVRLGLEVS